MVPPLFRYLSQDTAHCVPAHARRCIGRSRLTLLDMHRWGSSSGTYSLSGICILAPTGYSLKDPSDLLFPIIAFTILATLFQAYLSRSLFYRMFSKKQVLFSLSTKKARKNRAFSMFLIYLPTSIIRVVTHDLFNIREHLPKTHRSRSSLLRRYNDNCLHHREYIPSRYRH